MQKNFELLIIGRRYENELGEVKKIVKNNNYQMYPYIDEQGRCYTPKGRISHLGTSKYDLVKVLPEEPSQPTNHLAELEARRAELDKEIAELKTNIQMVYCATYTYGMSKDQFGFCTYESDTKRQELIDTCKEDNSPVPATFDLPFQKVNGKWEPAFKIIPLDK